MQHLTHIENSIIIAAHPDDEILWFSSVLGHVDKILLCYITCDNNRKWTDGRKKAISLYPLTNISHLDLHESNVFNTADWKNPVQTEYGLEIPHYCNGTSAYKRNYFKMLDLIRQEADGYKNIITHNPWGEYGNEEHIQVYKVLKKLQAEMNFDLWFSNYFSNKSAICMTDYFKNGSPSYLTMNTNKTLSDDIIHLYKDNGCWTWYDSWDIFNEESLIKDNKTGGNSVTYGHIVPLNFITVEPQIPSRVPDISFAKRTINKVVSNKNRLEKRLRSFISHLIRAKAD